MLVSRTNFPLEQGSQLGHKREAGGGARDGGGVRVQAEGRAAGWAACAEGRAHWKTGDEAAECAGVRGGRRQHAGRARAEGQAAG